MLVLQRSRIPEQSNLIQTSSKDFAGTTGGDSLFVWCAGNNRENANYQSCINLIQMLQC